MSIVITPVILCGGSGTRLWPLSRQHHPKQFLKLLGETTLFQQSVSRMVALQNNTFKIKEILIVTNENHRFLLNEQLDEMKIKIPTRILLEPEPRNTAPALTLAALAAEEKKPESLLVITPADHYVKNLEEFTLAMHAAIKAIKHKVIVTLGIEPIKPDIGFGYIQYEGKDLVKNVLTFKEKPDLKEAQKMINQGQHVWNGGMFILQSKTWLNAIQQSNSKINHAVTNSWQQKKIDQWFERPDPEIFKQSPSDSIDYVVMEKAQELKLDIKLVLLNAGWSDLGSFDALDNIETKDRDGNILKGNVVALNSKNTIAITSKKNVSLLGVENLIVIESADSVLVANKDDVQSIKQLVKILEKNYQELLVEHSKVFRPWGWFEIIEEGSNFKVKRILVNPGAKLSYQSHKYRNEHWVVIKGKATIVFDGQQQILDHDESTYIKIGVKHQLMNQEKDSLEIIEVQTGTKVIEKDIERYEDIYGRV